MPASIPQPSVVNAYFGTVPPAPVYAIPSSGPPGGNVAALKITNEYPTGAINGINATYTTAFSFIPESVEVFLNGLRQQKVIDFQTVGNQTIQLSVSPTNGEVVLINYQRS